MYCPQCGTQNDTSAAFCKNCGEKLEGVATRAEVTPVTENKTGTTNYTPSVRYANDPVLNSVKKLVLSPLSFAAAIAFSLMIILNISNAEILGTNLLGYLSQVSDVAGIYELRELKSELYALNGFFRLFVAIGMIPQIVIAIGLWMTISTSFKKGDDFSLSGMKAIKVINIISFVFAIVGLIASTGLYLWLIQLMADANHALTVASSVVMLVSIGIMAFNIYYKKQILNVINSFISTVKEKTPIIPGKFVAVMCFIGCGSFVILGIISPSSVTWCSAIAFLCFGMLIIKTRNVLIALKAENFLSNESGISDTGVIEQTSDMKNSGQIVKKTESRGTKNKKAIAIISGFVVAAIIILILSTSTAPGIDKAIVGKWSYGNSAETTFQFKRNGVFIGNEGTDYEERGTYTAGDGIISVVIDGEVVDHNYRVIDSDEIQIYRSYITSNWERKYRWETLYRIK